MVSILIGAGPKGYRATCAAEDIVLPLSAIAFPMPREPPVTKIVFPASFLSPRKDQVRHNEQEELTG